MQTVSAELAAAILAPERRALVRIRCDWNRSGSYTDLAVKDLSADVVGVDVLNELATDLPPEVSLFAGSAVAEATVTLSHRDPDGDPAKHGAWYYSPANPSSPLAGFNRKGAPAQLELGFVTVNGPEYVTVLTGNVRSLQVTSGGGWRCCGSLTGPRRCAARSASRRSCRLVRPRQGMCSGPG